MAQLVTGTPCGYPDDGTGRALTAGPRRRALVRGPATRQDHPVDDVFDRARRCRCAVHQQVVQRQRWAGSRQDWHSGFRHLTPGDASKQDIQNDLQSGFKDTIADEGDQRVHAWSVKLRCHRLNGQGAQPIQVAVQPLKANDQIAPDIPGGRCPLERCSASAIASATRSRLLDQ